MAESKEYMTLPEENGSINIAEEVIAAIAVGAVREVEGVSGMMNSLGNSVSDLVTNRKNAQQYGHAIPEVAKNAQTAVSSAVEAMTGCAVEAVNIHVGGVALN